MALCCRNCESRLDNLSMSNKNVWIVYLYLILKLKVSLYTLKKVF